MTTEPTSGRNPIRWIAAAFVVAAASLAAVVLFRWPNEPPRALDTAAPQDHGPTGESDAAVSSSAWQADCIGDSACAECHSELAERYRRTPMGRSFARVASADARAVPSEVTDERSGYRYVAALDDGRLVQREFSPDRAVAPGHHDPVRSEAAAWRIGSGDHAAAFLWESDGALSVLPLVWYEEQGRWGLNPGYEARNRRFDRTVSAGCLSCHATWAEHDEPAPNRFHIAFDSGIGCERCHGPGRAHAERWRAGGAAGDTGRAAPTSTDPTIIEPSRLTAARGNDVCFQCHLAGDVVLHREGSGPFSFRPGDALAEHRIDFLLGEGGDESFGVASHAARLMASRCWKSSARAIRCVDCHAVHGPADQASVEARSAGVCADCHASDACRRPDRAVADDARCVSCHMPRRPTREGTHLVFTDHRIRRRRPESPAAPFVLPPNAPQVDLRPVSAEPDAQWRAAALVELHLTMSPQEPALRAGVEELQALAGRQPLAAPARRKLIEGLISLGASDEALVRIERERTSRPSDVELRYFRAVCFDQKKFYESAAEEYMRVIDDAPHWIAPYSLLVRLELYRQNPRNALALLEQHERFAPLDAGGWTQRALAIRLRGDMPQAALAPLNRALSLDPRHVPALLAMADTLAQAGDRDGAVRVYRRLLAAAPDHPQAEAGLRALGEP